MNLNEICKELGIERNTGTELVTVQQYRMTGELPEGVKSRDIGVWVSIFTRSLSGGLDFVGNVNSDDLLEAYCDDEGFIRVVGSMGDQVEIDVEKAVIIP